MRVFVFVGANRGLKSRLSIKFWKIGRSGKVIKVRWGPARVDHAKRRILCPDWQGKDIRFRSDAEAKMQVRKRIAAQSRQGYHRVLPPRAHRARRPRGARR